MAAPILDLNDMKSHSVKRDGLYDAPGKRDGLYNQIYDANKKRDATPDGLYDQSYDANKKRDAKPDGLYDATEKRDGLYDQFFHTN